MIGKVKSANIAESILEQARLPMIIVHLSELIDSKEALCRESHENDFAIVRDSNLELGVLKVLREGNTIRNAVRTAGKRR